MATVAAAHDPEDVKPILPVSPASSSIMATQDRLTTSPPDLKPGYDGERGRRRSRSPENDGIDQAGDGDGNQANSSNSDGPTRKRRRSRKGLDKKFECPHEGCGKSYSRAEHLYRHQLNHNPKQVYTCDYPDCKRTFVRLDLCNRHKDRHTAKGSSLNRRDSLARSSPVADRPPFVHDESASPETNRPAPGYRHDIRTGSVSYQSPRDHVASPYSPVAHTPPPVFSAGGGSNGIDDYGRQDAGYSGHAARRGSYHSGTAPQRPAIQTSVNSYGVLSPVSTQQGFHGQQNAMAQSAGYAPQQNFPQFTLPPSNFSETPREREQQYVPTSTGDYADNGQQSAGDMIMLDSMSPNQILPVFGNESISNNSPHFLPEDFVQYLFDGSNNSPTMGPVMGQGYPQNHLGYSNNYATVPYLGNEATPLGGYFPASSQQVMAVSSILDNNLPETTISDEKSNEIFEYIKDRFLETGRAPMDQHREYIVEGDRTQDEHMLSKRMMQAYIGSYWLHFSDQIPILHKPTFSPDKTPNLLLLAMMTIGAACLDIKTHGTEVTQAGSKVSNFLAWHIRWEIFMDEGFRPPAKLWIFQSMLLLELYEKMYSTRELHERAHIHHATTITLMRRGRSLIGKSALDSPPNPADQRAGLNGSRQSSASGAATPDEWWNHWIMNEATRRAAFAAFVIDSIHATMFGHSTVMVAHEMRLPLPCDETLWKAASSAEVGRIDANLMSNNIKPVSFLEGLKRTLSGQEVRTNSFGRMVLMAGLLSVTWHMNQRDMQVNVLGGGVATALGGRDKWRGTLNRAFDSWKTDFDKALEREEASNDPYRYDVARRKENDVARESRIVLHHLAHMAMHVDVIDCQIFARAKRLLGRPIGPQDLSSAQRRMRDQWAPTAKARDATFYALKFLCIVLMPEAAGGSPRLGEPYSARDDVQLNRPWVLYFAVMVVWCYGYAIEGPCPEAPAPRSQVEKGRLMQDYLVKYGGIQTPDDLKGAKGINNNTALLMVLKDAFASTRWELLHEGGILLANCIALNAGRM